ncbi:hypothetical protein HOO54_11110 [Bacillus sp. WMMC1349]|uniref:hypothetical protein n=1 Tax=Bacillus sp. WMMC1349 TaxID=2736254 RepID=UPI001555C477|nr:hypothetical protein [Bacillus sp. WMMC1349]NPC92762.1 hypothetical protein [Bacillus sp. WMMC1349]
MSEKVLYNRIARFLLEKLVDRLRKTSKFRDFHSRTLLSILKLMLLLLSSGDAILDDLHGGGYDELSNQ